MKLGGELQARASLAAGEGISWQDIPCCTEKSSRGTIELHKVSSNSPNPTDATGLNKNKKTALEQNQSSCEENESLAAGTQVTSKWRSSRIAVHGSGFTAILCNLTWVLPYFVDFDVPAYGSYWPSPSLKSMIMLCY